MSNFWRNIPVLRILIPFLLGVFFQVLYQFDINFWVALAILLGTVLFIKAYWSTVSSQRNSFFGILISIQFFLLGAALCELKTPISNPSHFSHYTDVTFLDCVVSNIPEQSGKSFKATANVQSVFVRGQVYNTSGELLLYLYESSNLKLNKGDRVMLTITPSLIEGPQNPDEFNYKRYLSFHGIYHRVMISDSDQLVVLQKNYISFWIDPFEKLRISLVETLRKALTDQNAFSVGSALILGQKNYLSPEMKTAYSSSGAMHVLAVSGLHVGIIYLLIVWLSSFIKGFKGDIWFQLGIILTVLWVYAAVTGLSPSVLRACTMFSVVGISKTLGRKSSIYNSLAAAALILLSYNPYLITEVGFQLSFAAVLGIVIFQKPIYDCFLVRNKILDKIWQITCVSIAAQIATFPMGILYFHQFPNYFLLSNLVVIPAAFLVLSLGLSVLFFQFLDPAFNLLGQFLNWLIQFLNFSVVYIEQLPHALSAGLFFSIFEVWTVYLVIIFLAGFIYHKRIYLLYFILLSCVLLMFSFSIRVVERKFYKTIVINNIKGQTSLNFIDGQNNILLADSALIDNDARQVFHLKNFWYRLGYNKATYLSVNDTSTIDIPGFYRKGNFINFHGRSLYLINEGKQDKRQNQLATPPVDFLVMSGKTKIEKFQGETKKVVVSSGYKYRKLCCNSQEEYFDVRKSGALVHQYNN